MLTTPEIYTLLQIVTNIPGDRNRRGIPTLLEGFPAQAKTAIIEQYAVLSGISLQRFLLSQINADELIGIPTRVPTNESTGMPEHLYYVPQKWAVETVRSVKPTLIFFNEFNLANKDVLDAAQTFLTHGTLGSLQLPSTTTILGDQNPASMVGGTPLSPAMASRWLHVKWEPLPLLEWLDYVQTLVPGSTPSEDVPKPMHEWDAQKLIERDWPASFRTAISLISAYLRVNSDQRYVLPPSHDDARQHGWCNDRTWVMLARVLAGCEVFSVPKKSPILYTLLSGCIGEKATRPFLEWLSHLNLPTPQEVLEGRWRPSLQRHDIAYLVQQNLIYWAKSLSVSDLEKSIRPLYKIVMVYYEERLPDLGHLYLQSLQKNGWFLRDQQLLATIMRVAGAKAIAAEEVGSASTVGKK